MAQQDARLRRLRGKAMKLPLRPGVYIMKDSSAKIIYIGKAKALKNRVSQYFGSQNNHPRKVRRMVENVEDFDYIITDSEYEALVLECNLIKLHTPRYNILLKDDKGYHYIRISREPYPRISEAKQVADDGARYLGPYTSGFTVKQSVDEALKIFRLPSCRRKFPQEIGKGRPCLNYSIKQCMAPCTGKISYKEYNDAVNEAIEFLEGGTKETIRRLTERMEAHSENLEFEKAAALRDRIT
ncbi:MAG: GIY-YIG nuclease family protein, partial [Clostridia bacterium]|nr:GIY-YIG nuclease family protein [Clostridia bacterium]